MMSYAWSLVGVLAAVARGDEVTVTLDGLGQVRGSLRGTVREFHSVPYGQAPEGELRWRSPVEVKPWDGVYDATRFGAACAQPSGFTPTITNTSEDCLSITWYSPESADGTNPVFVWIHGGGFANGGSNEARLNGTAAISSLERETETGGGLLPVIAVIQYRLGVFGFAGSEELRDPTTNTTGNWGFEDQRAALKFVNAHAKAFGGDASNGAARGRFHASSDVE